MAYTLLPVTGTTKPLYTVKDNPALFAKGELTRKEIALQRAAADLGIAPPIVAVIPDHGGRKYVAVMQRITGTSLADFYGESPDSIPDTIWTQIHTILQRLWNAGIEYVDITPYNFMLETGTDKVWVVDFGHARQLRMNWFMRRMLERMGTMGTMGPREWTPDFI